jgi:hypothetical protein
MSSITYKIFFDKIWYYLLDFDNKNNDLARDQINDIEKLTSVVSQTVLILNSKRGRKHGK